jgi:hypothetical protein
MAKIERALAEVGELLAVLTVRLGSANIEEIPRLIDDAKEAARFVLRCCLASDSVGELPQEEAAVLRAELTRLGDALARISHKKMRIGAPNQRKLLCRNDIAQIRGTPRCRQSVTRNHLILEPWKVAVWKRHSMAGWSPPTQEHCCWERPIERSE